MSSEQRLWEVKHPFYCTEGGYFWNQTDRKTIHAFGSWAEFLADMGNSDEDMNFLFRWDWSETDSETDEPTFNGDVYYRNGELKLFFMIQRKGFHSTHLVEVCRADEPAVRAWLQLRLDYLMRVWAPLTASGAQA
jgi:hypothetical protein